MRTSLLIVALMAACDRAGPVTKARDAAPSARPAADATPAPEPEPGPPVTWRIEDPGFRVTGAAPLSGGRTVVVGALVRATTLGGRAIAKPRFTADALVLVLDPTGAVSAIHEIRDTSARASQCRIYGLAVAGDTIYVAVVSGGGIDAGQLHIDAAPGELRWIHGIVAIDPVAGPQRAFATGEADLIDVVYEPRNLTALPDGDLLLIREAPDDRTDIFDVISRFSATGRPRAAPRQVPAIGAVLAHGKDVLVTAAIDEEPWDGIAALDASGTLHKRCKIPDLGTQKSGVVAIGDTVFAVGDTGSIMDYAGYVQPCQEVPGASTQPFASDTWAHFEGVGVAKGHIVAVFAASMKSRAAGGLYAIVDADQPAARRVPIFEITHQGRRSTVRLGREFYPDHAVVEDDGGILLVGECEEHRRCAERVDLAGEL